MLVTQSLVARAIELRKAAVACDGAYVSDSDLGRAAAHLAESYRCAARMLEERAAEWLRARGIDPETIARRPPPRPVPKVRIPGHPIGCPCCTDGGPR